MIRHTKYFFLLFLFWGLGTKAQQSFSLQEAIDFAMENSYMTQDADLDVLKAKEQVQKTLAQGFPQIQFSATYQNYIEQPVNLIPAEFLGGEPGEYAEIIFGTKHNMGLDATLNQLIFDGRYMIGVRGSKKYLEMTQDMSERTRVEIKNIITQLYGAALVSDENLKVLTETRDNLQNTLNETKALYENGFVDQESVDQLQLLVSTTENQLRYATRQVYISYGLLKFSMGIDIDSDVLLSDDLEGLITNVTGAVVDESMWEYENHIDYVLARDNTEIREMQVKLAQANYYPSLSAFFTYQQNSFANEFNFTSSNAAWYPTQLLGVSLNMPIFTSGMNHSEVQEAKVALDKAYLNELKVGQDLKLNLQTSKSDFLLAYDFFLVQRDNLELAKKINDRQLVKYNEGLSSSLDLMNAQNQYLSNQNEYISSIYNLIVSKAELEKALNTQK
jgi:outer membrane protein TolC